MSGGGSGGSTVVEPSTTTTVQDIPTWEQGYVTDLLGQAQTEAAQPYQQFPGQQVAGFTNDQNQAFSNIEGAGATNAANQNAAMGQAQQGANTANSIYGAGAGDVNAASTYNPLDAVSPYLGAASGYNAAAAAQPYLNQSQGYNAAAAGVASPQGIQSYLSPYTQNVVGGLENTANQNWNQNIMPGVNNEFVGSGQYGSGRNAQVLGQAANEEQTNLNTSVANALQSGYTTAGNQAATEAGILGNAANTAISGANTAGGEQTAQIGNLLNQGNAASTATNQQAANLVNQGTALGNLASTQAGQQLNAGTALSNIGTQAANTNLTQNQALQATGQEQQQLDQANLNTAMQNWTNQTQYPEQQSQFLNQIIRGLPAPSATTSAGQTPAYSVSPLSGIGGAGIGTLALSGSNGQALGTAQAAKKGGLIKNYAEGGKVDDDSYGADDEDMTPLDYATMPDSSPDTTGTSTVTAANPLDQTPVTDDSYGMDDAAPVANDQSAAPDQISTASDPIPYLDAPDTKSSAVNPLDMDDNKSSGNAISNNVTPAQTQQLQLLALARGMLTPQMNGSSLAAFGQGLGNVADVTMRQNQLQAAQNNLNYQRQQEAKRIDIEQQNANSNKDYKNWRMENTGVGAYDTMARGLMKDNPDLSYQDALSRVINKNVGGTSAKKPASPVVTMTDNNSASDNNSSLDSDSSDGKIADNKNLTGDAYLATLDPKRAAAAKAIAMGDQQYPSAYALAKSPQLQQDLDNARQYDPTTNGRRYGNLQKWDTGTLGNTTRSINTSIAHLDTASQLSDALGNGDAPLVNKIANTWAQQTGSAAPNNFDTAKQIVSTEVMKSISNANAGGQAEREELQKRFDNANSPQQLKGAIGTAQKLLVGQAGSLGSQYKSSTGRDDFIQSKLSPASQAVYAKYTQTPTNNQPSGGTLIGTSGGKKVYQLPDGSHVMEQ